MQRQGEQLHEKTMCKAVKSKLQSILSINHLLMQGSFQTVTLWNAVESKLRTPEGSSI